MKRLMGGLAAALAIGAFCSVAFAADDATVGYVKGTWTSECSGEPLEYGTCNPSDQVIRCFQVKNPEEEMVTCNISMAATTPARGDQDWGREDRHK